MIMDLLIAILSVAAVMPSISIVRLVRQEISRARWRANGVTPAISTRSRPRWLLLLFTWWTTCSMLILALLIRAIRR